MIETAPEKQWRRELDSDGETAVRDSLNYGGGIATGGEPKRQFVIRDTEPFERIEIGC